MWLVEKLSSFTFLGMVPLEKDIAIIGCGNTDLAERIPLYAPPREGSFKTLYPPLLRRPVELAGLNRTYRNEPESLRALQGYTAN
jgi:hypothetical protein